MHDAQAGIGETQRVALAAWCARSGVELCVLFGSRAVGKGRPGSDVDLALRPLAPAQRLDWQLALEDLLGGAVDIVALSSATEPVLGWEIARTGRLIYERCPGQWAQERARLWHCYNDALPFRRALAASLRRFADEVRGVS